MTAGDEEAHTSERSEWLARHHSRWSSSPQLLHRIVRHAGVVPDRFERLVAGQANEVYSVTTAAGSDLILRVGWRPDPRFETEAAVIGVVRRGGIPAPEVVAVGRLQEEDGPTGYILEERLSGVMLRDLVLAGGELEPVLGELGELVAGIHQIGVQGYGNLSPDLTASHSTCSQWFVDMFVERHLPGVIGALEGDAGAEHLVRRATELMTEQRSALDACPARLAHGDVSPTNVLVDGGRVTGIVDWESAKGAPQANDLAWWTSGTVSLARPPDVELLLRGYRRVLALEAGFWTAFRLCQLRILMGRIGHAADVDDVELKWRTVDQLGRMLESPKPPLSD